MSDNSPEDVGGASEAGGWTGGQVLQPGDRRRHASLRGSVRCPSCRKPIRFITMESGKPMPVEARSVQVVVEKRTTPQADLFGNGDPPQIRGRVVQGWTPHWENCSEPQRWRR